MASHGAFDLERVVRLVAYYAGNYMDPLGIVVQRVCR